jgi:three-Cys-motif partner protein
MDRQFTARATIAPDGGPGNRLMMTFPVHSRRMEVKTDPTDGRPALEAGEWNDEKHRLLREYVDASHGVRLGWTNQVAAARRGITNPAGATYIELFSGPGRVFIRDRAEFRDGSPLVAFEESKRRRTAFTAMHLGDERADFCEAVKARLEERGAHVVTYPMRAELAADQVVEALDPYALHFAFLDSFGFEGAPFSIIKKLSRFEHMDLLIYVSAMGLQRKLEHWLESPKPCPLDDFAPGWRAVVKGARPGDIVARGLVYHYWLDLIRGLGFKGDAQGRETLIRGPNRQPLYWLVLVAKHELAQKFWKAITKEDQFELFK